MTIQINFDKDTGKFLLTELEYVPEECYTEIVNWEWVDDTRIAEVFCDWEDNIGMDIQISKGAEDYDVAESMCDDQIAQWWEDLYAGKKVEIDW